MYGGRIPDLLPLRAPISTECGTRWRLLIARAIMSDTSFEWRYNFARCSSLGNFLAFIMVVKAMGLYNINHSLCA